MPKVAQLRAIEPAPRPRAAVAVGQRAQRPSLRYFAFLSYSHQDAALAAWLHRKLEQFRVPLTLVGRNTANGPVPRRLTPIFRDQHELAAASDLGAEIHGALAASHFLIVLCSPAAARSRWVNAEIESFKRARPDGCVLAAIGAGEPFASDRPDGEAAECFPPALRHRYDRRGRPTGKRAEPLAADLRDEGDGKRSGLLKLVAGMLGVGLDELVQRAHVRRQRRLALLAAASLAGMTVTSGLAFWAVQARDEARDQRREAEGLVGFMLGDLKEKLEPIGRLDALDAVGSRALDYFEKQEKTELSDAALSQRARALTLMGEIAHTRGDLNGALQRYSEALASTGEALRRYPDDAQRVFDHAQNVYWIGYVDYQRGQPQSAAARFGTYRRLADRMVALAPDKKEYRLEQVYANTNLGTVQMEVRRYRQAVATYQASLAAAELLAAAEPRNVDYQKQVISGLAWLADAHEFSGSIDQALAERERQLRLLGALEQLDPRDSEVQRDAMTTHRAIGRLHAARGDVRSGLGAMRASVAISETLFRIEPDNTEWLQASVASRYDLADLLLASNQAGQAGIVIRSACDITGRLASRDATVSDWKSRLRANCFGLRARLALAENNPQLGRALAADALAAASSSPKPLERQVLRSAALTIGGNASAALGDRAQARQQWQNALAALPGSIEFRPNELDRMMRLHRNLGNQAEARRMSLILASMGYRYPASGRSS